MDLHARLAAPSVGSGLARDPPDPNYYCYYYCNIVICVILTAVVIVFIMIAIMQWPLLGRAWRDVLRAICAGLLEQKANLGESCSGSPQPQIRKSGIKWGVGCSDWA